MNFKEFVANKIVVLDGAMGTMLQKNGLHLGENPEELNIKNGELIKKIHGSYLKSGADVILSNTFGANTRKLSNTKYTIRDIIKKALELAREAVTENGSGYVAYDMGPIGELLEPMGTLTFEEAYDIFCEQVECALENGAELVVIETMTDLQEVRAALLAVKENSSLPIICMMSFEENGRTFMGCDPAAAVMVVEGLGADAVGINCSLGPNLMIPIVERMLKFTSLPVVVKANAGLPNPDGTIYGIGIDAFADYYKILLEMGVTIIGGCCGTTPEYIKKLHELSTDNSVKQKSITSLKTRSVNRSCVCTSTKVVGLDTIRVIGERINPTGKKRFKQALISEEMDYISKQAFEQIDAGADILDVNVGLPEIDEKTVMEKVVKLLGRLTDIPLQIDSSDPRVIESALRIYCGKAIVNSVNGDNEVLETILPIVKKYGASVVGLTLDKNGIPSTADERFEIAKKILDSALLHGLKSENVYIDCLTLTVSAEQEKAKETLNSISRVKNELGLKTVLGVSNISFGLPLREYVNTAFLLCALQCGLDLPIINPNAESMMAAIRSYKVLQGHDKNCVEYVSKYGTKHSILESNINSDLSLSECVIKGMREECIGKIERMLKTIDGMTIINENLIPILDQVGQSYENGEIFLPQLIQAAETAKCGFDVIKCSIDKEGDVQKKSETIVLAAVKGDIHDIGKNIVKTVLENYGYNVVDLGRDVSPESIVEAVKKYSAGMVGLSALMTTTVKSMETTISLLSNEKLGCKTVVGGAVMTQDYASRIGADYYAKDANDAVKIAKLIFSR